MANSVSSRIQNFSRSRKSRVGRIAQKFDRYFPSNKSLFFLSPRIADDLTLFFLLAGDPRQVITRLSSPRSVREHRVAD